MRTIKVSRQELIEMLMDSWRRHYEVCDDDYLATEYEQEFDDDVTIEVIE